MDRLLSMRVFQKVIDEGGFAAAGRALDMSAAGVTRLISDLERHLNARLIQRTTRKLALTEAGETYLARVRAILSDIDDAEAVTLAHTQELSGVLRVQAPPALAVHHLAPLIGAFRQRYPRLVLDLHVDSPLEPPVENFDITLLAADAGFDGNVVARAITSTLAVLCAAPAYLQRKGVPQTPAELVGHDCLKLKSLQRLRSWRLYLADDSSQHVEVAINPVVYANHTDTLLQATLAGAGISSQPVVLVAPYFESGTLQPLLPQWTTGEFTIYAALPTRKHIPARTRVFLEFLTEQAQLAAQAATVAP
jgi:DNA-binding transcriptional LysR family regulator